MPHILLLFPAEKKAVAGQIRDSLNAAGYGVTPEEVALPDGRAMASKIGGKDAALLVWSRGLAAAADFEGWLAELRKLPNLIEISTDGIAPQGGDESRVVLLSGWRGQPFHLGWQRMLGELERLAGRGSPPPKSAAAVPEASTGGRSSPATEASGRSPVRVARARFILPAAATVALLGTLAAASLTGSGSADVDKARPEPAPAVAPRLAPAEPAPLAAAPAPAPGPAAVAAVPEVPPLPPAAGRPPEPEKRTSGDRAAPVRPRDAAAASRPPATSRAARPAPVLKRYSKKHSKIMRRFCARSGRHTPECRVFLRSTQASRS
jgi:hypothetical protein